MTIQTIFKAGSLMLAIALLAPPLSAVTPFARKYGTSCMTCHVAPPKLNAFGRAFKNLGYRMPGGDAGLVKQDETSLGAPAWKRVWPAGVWPSSIPGGEFMGIALASNYEVNPSEEVSNQFDGIEEIGLLLGGTVGERFSYFGDVDLFEGGEPGHIGRLFFQYNHSSNFINVKIGQFEPAARPFSNHMRLARGTNYLTNTFPTIPAGNFFGFSPNQRGAELWGSLQGHKESGGLTWAVGVVNGNFGGAAEALEADHEIEELLDAIREAGGGGHGSFDVNSGKDVYFRLAYKIGGMGVLGSEESEVLSQTDNWRDDSLTVGGYYYRGTQGAFLEQHEEPPGEEHNDAALLSARMRSSALTLPRVRSTVAGEEPPGDHEEFGLFDTSGNEFYRAGFTFDAWLWDFNLYGGWQRNHDMLEDGRAFNVDIPMVELDYVTPWPWVQPSVRFEQVRPDFGPSFKRYTLALTLLVRANVVVSLDGSRNSDSAPALPPFDDRFRAGVRFYF